VRWRFDNGFLRCYGIDYISDDLAYRNQFAYDLGSGVRLCSLTGLQHGNPHVHVGQAVVDAFLVVLIPLDDFVVAQLVLDVTGLVQRHGVR
jgi:hypothetical protein